jgi:hypothetical protein
MAKAFSDIPNELWEKAYNWEGVAFNKLTDKELMWCSEYFRRGAATAHQTYGSGCPGMEGELYHELMHFASVAEQIEDDRGWLPESEREE